MIDDIQWGERVPLDLLDGLPPALPGRPVLILSLARPELLGRDPDWPVTVRLAPLAPGAVDALLAGLGAPPRPAREARRGLGRQPAVRGRGSVASLAD